MGLLLVADLALFCHEGRIALLFDGDRATGGLAETVDRAYPLARGNWHTLALPAAEVISDPPAALSALRSLIARLGGPQPLHEGPDSCPTTSTR